MPRLIAVFLPLLAAATGAQAYTIDFGETGSPLICTGMASGLGAPVACGDYNYLSQSHGDVAGVSDITYSAPRAGSPTSLRWWSTGYNALYGVAWADGSDGNSQARVEIKAVQPTDIVTLSSFDLGAFPNTTRSTTVTVTTIGGGSTLYTFAGQVGTGNSGNLPTTFAPDVSAAGGLWITWQDSAYNVGIDKISYSVSAVPEPAALALMLAGLGVVGLRARRRNQPSLVRPAWAGAVLPTTA